MGHCRVYKMLHKSIHLDWEEANAEQVSYYMDPSIFVQNFWKPVHKPSHGFWMRTCCWQKFKIAFQQITRRLPLVFTCIEAATWFHIISNCSFWSNWLFGRGAIVKCLTLQKDWEENFECSSLHFSSLFLYFLTSPTASSSSLSWRVAKTKW